MPAFFDTNVPVYVTSGDEAKARRAQDLIAQGGWISVQVLNEMTRVLRGKLGYSWTVTRAALTEVRSALEVIPVDIETHQLGLDLAERYRLAVFDAMIAAAALQSGCDTLYSEDMHSGLRIDGRLTLVNPFGA